MSKSYVQLLYFTESYPFGLGEQWKTNELSVLVNRFENLHVIPRHYAGNRNPVSPIQGVTYHKPIFDEAVSKKIIKSFISTIFSSHRLYLLRELLEYCLFDAEKMKQWIGSCNNFLKVIQSPVIKKLLLNTNEKTIAYFFWGRGTAEIIPVINNSNVSSVIRLHGYDLYLERYKTRYIPFHSKVIDSCNKVLFVSQQGLEYTKRLYPSLSQKLIYAPLGSSDCGMARMSEDGILRIISCSSLIDLKRVSLLASALTRGFNYNIEWIHLGDGPLRDEVLEITGSFPYNISFTLTGWIASNRIREFYMDKCVDLFINVSTTEGVPISIMEAMSASVPVIATNVGGVSEIVNDSNGFLIPPNINAEMLKEVLDFFYRIDFNKKKAMRISARKTYEEFYHARNNAKKLVEILAP